ncbi:hypothetical protein LUZ60_012211 [Juncus effusus]|nr:hypothetical protein LUZ60_012211 [Juncus effusus]
MSGKKLAFLPQIIHRRNPISSSSSLLRGFCSASSDKSVNGANSNSEANSSSNSTGGGGKRKSLARRLIPIGLISLAGGFALSAVNDLAIFHGCTKKAIEKASENQKIVESIGVPIMRGPWYDASLAVGHKRSSVSCTFPVSGPNGSAIFQLKAIRNGDDGMFSFMKHHDWEILLMEALIHVPSNDETNQSFRISLTDPLQSDSLSSS